MEEEAGATTEKHPDFSKGNSEAGVSKEKDQINSEEGISKEKDQINSEVEAKAEKIQTQGLTRTSGVDLRAETDSKTGANTKHVSEAAQTSESTIKVQERANNKNQHHNRKHAALIVENQATGRRNARTKIKTNKYNSQTAHTEDSEKESMTIPKKKNMKIQNI